MKSMMETNLKSTTQSLNKKIRISHYKNQSHTKATLP